MVVPEVVVRKGLRTAAFANTERRPPGCRGIERDHRNLTNGWSRFQRERYMGRIFHDKRRNIPADLR